MLDHQRPWQPATTVWHYDARLSEALTTSNNCLTLWRQTVRGCNNQQQPSDTATPDRQRLWQPVTTIWHCDTGLLEPLTTSDNYLTLQHWTVRGCDNQRRPSDTVTPDHQRPWQPATTVWHCNTGLSEPLTTSDNRLTLQCQIVRAFDNQRQLSDTAMLDRQSLWQPVTTV